MQFPSAFRTFMAAGLLVATACAPLPTGAPQSSDVGAARAPVSARASAEQAPKMAADNVNTTNSFSGRPTKTVKVGLLLPLTGRNADLGKAMQDAAAVSLFDKYARLSVNQQSTKVELLPKDTGDSPEFARAAMESALKDGAEIIIGPIFSDATEASAPIATAKNISVLSFSNNRNRAGSGTYLLGFSPQEQATRVVDYAVTHGKKHIAVLVPHSPLGDEVLAAAQASAQNAGVTLAVTAQYAPQGGGLDAALTKLVSAGSAPSFDALLLAESGPTLETVLRSLASKGVTPSTVQLLGTGLWDDAALLKRVNLDGAWFASSAPTATQMFDARFRNTYNYMPPRIASLSYDAVALAVTLAVSGRAYTEENLTNKAGFMGPANGIFRLHADGTVERALAVIQVSGSSLQVISSAPTGFIAN